MEPRRILVIDDEPGLREVLSRQLSAAGYQVQTVGDLPHGLALMEEGGQEVICCDIRLPLGSGLDILERATQLPGSPLVIMMTGHPTLETAQLALRQGAFDYLTKPIRMEALLRAVDHALKTRDLETERKRLHLHLDAVFNSVEEALITVDPELTLVAANRAAGRICALHPEHLGLPLATTGNGCSRECLPLVLQAMATRRGGTVKRVACLRSPDENQVVDITATPILDEWGAISGALLAVRDETPLVRLENNLQLRRQFHRLVGQSQPMQELYRMIETLADVETTVLITGESGTGKELVAEAIHRQGRRRDQPLVKVNCAALTETLLESELFGHVRGAFTGALRDRVGRFQEADKGTLFLDEIGDTSPAMQLRLLRALQEKQIERVGDNRSLAVDVRIITATNCNLREKVARGEFREDLYYRIRVVEIPLPALRKRVQDIPLLVDHFIARFNHQLERKVTGVTDAALTTLMNHPWPGNIRELEHAMEHALIVCRDTRVGVEHLPTEFQPPEPPAPVPAPAAASPRVEEATERETILKALAECRWHRELAARRLGMSRSTLFRKMRQWDIRIG